MVIHFLSFFPFIIVIRQGGSIVRNDCYIF